MREQFLRFEGQCFINGRGVAAYKQDDGIKLQEEKQAGGKVGKPVYLEPQQYLDLHDDWCIDCASGQDAVIASRALAYVRDAAAKAEGQ